MHSNVSNAQDISSRTLHSKIYVNEIQLQDHKLQFNCTTFDEKSFAGIEHLNLHREDLINVVGLGAQHERLLGTLVSFQQTRKSFAFY